MPARRLDRHGRGLRGPLAAPNPYTGRAVRPAQPAGRSDFFAECVSDSIDRIGRSCPRALPKVTFGIEDVPPTPSDWTEGDGRSSGDQVPLAAAIEATAEAFARVVVYRRPLEHRARTRPGLRILVHRTIVEQLAALTGLEVETIDPEIGED